MCASISPKFECGSEAKLLTQSMLSYLAQVFFVHFDNFWGVQLISYTYWISCVLPASSAHELVAVLIAQRNECLRSCFRFLRFTFFFLNCSILLIFKNESNYYLASFLIEFWLLAVLFWNVVILTAWKQGMSCHFDGLILIKHGLNLFLPQMYFSTWYFF